jgi:hypothetical protein
MFVETFLENLKKLKKNGNMLLNIFNANVTANDCRTFFLKPTLTVD